MATQLPLFDGALSRANRDEALGRVGGNAGRFMADGLVAIRYLTFSEVTGEDIRRELMRQGIEPHHHNAWGALISGAVRRGILHETGRYTAMKDERSHARKTQIYKLCRSR